MTENGIHAGRAALRASAVEFENSGLFGDGLPVRLHAAMGGEFDMMADHIEAGGELTDPERKWLASYVRTGRKGRRKLDQRIKELKVVHWVASYRQAGKSEADAIAAVLNDPDLPVSWGVNSEETIRTYLRNWRIKR